MNHYEDNEQATLFEWAAFQSSKYPELSLLFHIPNGGKRNPREAARFKRMGVKPGVPDLFLPVARGGFHGLFVGNYSVVYVVDFKIFEINILYVCKNYL